MAKVVECPRKCDCDLDCPDCAGDGFVWVFEPGDRRCQACRIRPLDDGDNYYCAVCQADGAFDGP